MTVVDPRIAIEALRRPLQARYCDIVEEPLPPRLVQLLSLLARLPHDTDEDVVVHLPHELEHRAGDLP